MAPAPRRPNRRHPGDRLARAVHGRARQPCRHRRAAGIRADLGATLQSPGVDDQRLHPRVRGSLIPGAALGDRFGRRRLFLIGLSLFTPASAAAAPWRRAPAPSFAARALQGVGGAIVAPLTLTLLADAFPADRRGAALGIWSGISGTGVALGPIVGGAVVDGISWHWIFWINVPIGSRCSPSRRCCSRRAMAPRAGSICRGSAWPRSGSSASSSVLCADSRRAGRAR